MLIKFENFMTSPSGLVMPSTEEGDSFYKYICPIPSNNLLICFWTIDKFAEFASIYTSSSLDIK